MDVYKDSGYLMLGSRLKRLSERILQDVAAVYKQQNIPFEITWFPVFFQLDRRGNMSVTELSETLRVTHPAIVQMVDKLVGHGLVKSEKDPGDGRKRIVCFTKKGQRLLEKVKPVWQVLEQVMEGLMQENEHLLNFNETLGELERALDKKDILSRLNKSITP